MIAVNFQQEKKVIKQANVKQTVKLCNIINNEFIFNDLIVPLLEIFKQTLSKP